MKKWILYPLIGLVSVVFLLALTLVGILFFKPTVIINPATLQFALEKTKVLDSWSWSKARIDHEYVKWNDRVLTGEFRDLCFKADKPVALIDVCIEEISWNFRIYRDAELGFMAKTLSPFFIRSSKTNVTLKEKTEEEDSDTPPDIYGYWKMLWSKLTPELDIHFLKIHIAGIEKPQTFDFKLVKSPKSLKAEALGFQLSANRSRFILSPPAQYLIYQSEALPRPIYLRQSELIGRVSEARIDFGFKGLIESLPLQVNAQLELPVRSSFKSPEFLEKFLLTLEAQMNIPDVKQSLKDFGPPPYNELPAPLNEMSGSIDFNLDTSKSSEKESVVFSLKSLINLESEKQALHIGIGGESPLNLKTFSPGPIGLAIDFRKVALLMPRLSKKSLPPQFIPDSRIKGTPFNPKEEPKTAKAKKNQAPPPEINLDLEALGEKALHISTNLLEEALRLNFQFMIRKGELTSGFVQILPLKTTVFKRPIYIPDLKVTFKAPLEPVIDATIEFRLPEYKVELELEGPLSKPRYSFSSVPPLPQSDIYAVLLFGRPMADLNPDDKSAATRTNQILSQGLLSLSVLYFFAGSPIEYVGYDPESKNASAQIGLGNKNSLRVGGSGGGVNSTAVRRSLGKGWYLDTSVQKSSNLDSSESNNYGVLLERIIAY